ncbi:MAG: hydroxyacylglutathione hydrolase [Wenzhouxiangella sp.]|nr:hydroxyacylglutathione hydrolase [Wenzhouxiangella sp.]MCH8478971.1 hydroxyacylglutathione hydrolase [Wenzhouxiangella sp.]TVR99541.1 MAG: hydroxyacylglutathione hydrolase [Wenzhouxiangellaceae bacterium]
MPLSVEAIPAFETNYIWAIHNGHDCVLVDPGSSAEPMAFVQRRGLKLCALLLTHHHFDHIGGVDDILARHPVPTWGPKDPRMPQVNQHLAEGDQAQIPELALVFDVLETPGHTTTHIVYHGHDMLLAGDTLFSIGCGRLFEGTPAQMQASLDKLRGLPDQTRVYCAHEYTLDNCRFALQVEPDNPALRERAEQARRLREQDRITLPPTLAEERAANPFLRTREASVIDAANHHQPGTGTAPAAVFGVIRSWKDKA